MGIPALEANGRAHRGNVLVADSVLVMLVTGLALSTLIYRAVEGPEVPAEAIRLDLPNVLAVALLVAGTASLVWQRPNALPVLAISVGVFLASGPVGSVSPLLAFAPLMALYAVAANNRPAVSAATAGVLGIAAVVVFIANSGPLDDDVLDYVLSVGTAWLLGYGVWLNRVRTSLLDEQAAQLTREQTVKTQAAVRQEQDRIARELHDIVAHRVVVIVAQAGASKRMFDTEPERAKHALGSIETLGREALTEMRRLLGVLWADDGSKAPQPGLAELPALVGQMEQAGLAVELIVSGEQRTLPAGIELNAFRIVQEALTNTLKHSGSTRAEVHLSYSAESLELCIRDEGRGSSSQLMPGHGLVSMRQRAALLDGQLSVGPGPDGGFQVTAKLPVSGGRP